MPKIKVNGTEYECPPGKRLLEFLTEQKITVPYYCWHPGLTPAGNCRMCLVKVSTSRKLEVACVMIPTEGMEVWTEGPEVEKGRENVLEYMLINHPLDCPICDKAGECMLQDHTYDYRHGLSRFKEKKVIKHTKDLGPNVKIWGNRCISCTRCVRFCDEVTGTGELTISFRGDHSVADVHPDIPLDNPMSLNVVDICPVGALIDKNFMYQARVWFSNRTNTICGGCSRGCNITGTIYRGEIKRIQPRHNAEVNGHWMCDAGRLGLGFVKANRLTQGKGKVADLASALKAHHGRIGIVASTAHTLEELFLLRQLATALGAKVAFLTKDEGQRWVAKNGFAIERDKTPNRRGAEAIFGARADAEALVAGVNDGSITALLISNQIPELAWPAGLVAAAPKASVLAVADFAQGPLVGAAHYVLPTTSWAERDGTFMNRDGRIQRARALLPAQGAAVPAVVWLQDLLIGLGLRAANVSAEAVFREAFPGLDYNQVGELGMMPPTAEAASTSPAASLENK